MRSTRLKDLPPLSEENKAEIERWRRKLLSTYGFGVAVDVPALGKSGFLFPKRLRAISSRGDASRKL